MQDILLVGLGGFAGAIARFLVSTWIQSQSTLLGLPVGTLMVNVLGCLLIGILSQVGTAHGLFTAETRLLVFTGFLGAFTTFSTFGNETIGLVQKDQSILALLYIGLHLFFGFGAVLLGNRIGEFI
ncbi:MAG: fluoride efflux transporter CrcB [Chloroflexota bacterium]